MNRLFELEIIQPNFDELYKKLEDSFDLQKKQARKIGILNRGRNNVFINNTFSGLDIGIKDEGENTLASGNKFEERSKRREISFNIHPQIHYGKGDNVGRDKENSSLPKKSFWDSLLGQIIIGLIVTGIIALIAFLI